MSPPIGWLRLRGLMVEPSRASVDGRSARSGGPSRLILGWMPGVRYPIRGRLEPITVRGRASLRGYALSFALDIADAACTGRDCSGHRQTRAGVYDRTAASGAGVAASDGATARKSATAASVSAGLSD